MDRVSRRLFIAGAGTAALAVGLSQPVAGAAAQVFRDPRARPPADIDLVYAEMYGPIHDEPFPIKEVDLSRINSAFLRKVVAVKATEAPGTIVVDPARHYLYLLEDGERAIRYGVGVGRDGFAWSGVATINSKQEWPDWYPPKDMLERRSDLKDVVVPLRGGLGFPGGAGNPLGARALYLWQDNKDTLFRIHGTPEPWTIGQSLSSGCIRMINQDAIDLYQRVPVGTKVMVLGPGERTV